MDKLIRKKIIDFIFKEPTLDLKIKKDFDFGKKKLEANRLHIILCD